MSEPNRHWEPGAGSVIVSDSAGLPVRHRAGGSPDREIPGHREIPGGEIPGRDLTLAAEPAGAEIAAYELWGWPLTRNHDLIQLSMDSDASAIAIPIPLSIKVTRILIARHCAPAVLACPHAAEHHLVLTGERFDAPLPWPPGVYEITRALMLPPAKTLYGPITWVQPPSRDSLQLCREIDVFGALRSALNDSCG